MSWQKFEAGFGIDVFDDFDGEVRWVALSISFILSQPPSANRCFIKGQRFLIMTSPTRLQARDDAIHANFSHQRQTGNAAHTVGMRLVDNSIIERRHCEYVLKFS